MIKIQNLRKSFQRPGEAALNVLDDLDFSVDEGEFVAIVGTSGSGKTTLMNILGLLDRPDSGDYELHGKQVAKLSPEQRAKVRNEAIGFVFQQFHLLPKTTATENVELPMLYSSRSDADIRRRAREVSCPGGSNSEWPLRGRSSTIRPSSSPTSQPEISIRNPADKSWICFAR